jgi:hypothetical protein
MIEVLNGTGILRTLVPPPTEWHVRYNFDIRTDIIQRPGFPSVHGHSEGRGTVADIDGELIPQGTFELTAEDGEILRVKNLGIVWAIISG